MSLWKLAEVVAIHHEDGDIEHTQKKYMSETDTHLRKNWSLLCVSKKSAMLQKKQRHCRMRGRKDTRKKKTANRRCSKNAQRRKITLK